MEGRCKAMKIFITSILVLLISTPTQGVQSRGFSISSVMPKKDFQAAGLKKLSPTEIRALDTWLISFLLRMISDYAPIETQIDGEFEGWEGETLFKLMNGQVWQQSSYAYTYHYAYMPEVLIYKSGSRHKMRVDGVESWIYVERLR